MPICHSGVLHDNRGEPHSWMVGPDLLEVNARIVHDEPNAQVLDSGILAYHFIGVPDPEHQAQVGAWVTGEVNLSVDPFFYFVSIEKTDAWGEDGTLPYYLLRCRMEPAPRSAVRSLDKP